MINFSRKLLGKKPKYRVKAWSSRSTDYIIYLTGRLLIKQNYMVKFISLEHKQGDVIHIRKPPRYMGRDSIHNNS